jgi:hypothetical protein
VSFRRAANQAIEREVIVETSGVTPAGAISLSKVVGEPAGNSERTAKSNEVEI